AIAATRLFITAIFVPTLLFAVGRVLNISAIDFLQVLWRPLVAAALMAMSIGLLNWVFKLDGNWRLGFDVLLGAIVFAASLISLWIVSGKPPTPESNLFLLWSELHLSPS